MKRLLSAILILSVIVSMISTIGFATTEIADIDETVSPEYFADLKEAKELLDLLHKEVLFEDGVTISRGLFVSKLINLTNTITIAPESYFFGDVKSFTENADSIYTAVDKGWISKSDEFEHERPILPNEAIKILVNMMGYTAIAEDKGGYPGGYLYVANSTDLTDYIDLSKDFLTVDEAYMLLFKSLTALVPNQVGFGETERYAEGFDNMLYLSHRIKTVEGRVSATPYNTLYGEEPITKRNILGINEEEYDCEFADWDMLGTYVRGYIKCTDNSEEVIYLREMYERTKISLSDISRKDGTRVFYWTENSKKEKYINLASKFNLIVNGRKVTEKINDYFVAGAGEIVFSDDETQNGCETVYINNYDYITVSNIDVLNGYISDENSAEYSDDLSDVIYSIQNNSGQSLSIEDVKKGETFRKIKSLDGKLVILQRIGDTMEGVINKIEDSLITVDNTEYIISDYFYDNYFETLKLGAKSIFVIDEEILVSAVVGKTAMQYGFLLDCAQDGIFQNTVIVKIYTSAGEFEEYKLRERLTIDGENGKNSDTFVNMFNRQPQLIRYGLDGNGQIAYIDFESEELPEKPGIYPDERNCLTKYSYFPSGMRYKSSNATMQGYCNMNNAIIFSIPNDIKKEKLFAVQTKSVLVNDKTYTGEFYNMDENGAVSVMVYRNDNPFKISARPVPMLVKSVAIEQSDDGEEVYAIYGYYNNNYTTVYMPMDTEVTKEVISGTTKESSHPLLSSGDVITIGLNSKNEVTELKVIFDARKDVFSFNTEKVNTNTNASEMYYYGMVYSAGDNHMAIATKEKPGGGYDFAQEHLRYLNTNVSLIVRYNVKTGEIRPMTAADIKTYKTEGNNAHLALVGQDSYVTRSIILYEDAEVLLDE